MELNILILSWLAIGAFSLVIGLARKYRRPSEPLTLGKVIVWAMVLRFIFGSK